MPERFIAHMDWPADRGAPALRICAREGEVLVSDSEDAAGLADRMPDGHVHVLGSLGDRVCLAIDGTDHAAPDGTRWCGLRELHGLVEEALWAIAGRAVQIVEWDRTHRWCGRCGTPTVPAVRERARHCPRCELRAYPRVSPAVIVLVTRGEHEERALLAWGTHRARPSYSTLAGFVEPGETLEQAIEREIGEEVGIAVSDIRYFGSQSWPFPHQLMVGYRARFAGGELVLQESEIREARWFTPAEVQQAAAIRGGFSIAGQLIDGWLAEQAARNSAR